MKRPERREKRALIMYILFLLTSHFSLLTFLSCIRNDGIPASVSLEPTGALPSAIIQTGRYPLWFQLTERGPVHIESIEDAEETCPFIPWPLAVHVRFFYERNGELVMAVNRDGFIKLTPQEEGHKSLGITLYHFSGGEFWKLYTIGGFFNYENQDTVLLYLDERFLNSESPIPNHRTWTFNMESNTPIANSIPALELFPVQDGWDADTIRLSDDGYWYYRVRKRNAPQGLQPEIQMIKTENLAQAGISISIEDFFNSAPKEQPVDNLSLPPLPDGFVYTGTASVGDSLFASWEEQNGYSIGASGFMLVRE